MMKKEWVFRGYSDALLRYQASILSTTIIIGANVVYNYGRKNKALCLN